MRAHLLALGIEHELVPCDPDLADTAAFCAAYGFAPEDSANAIIVAGKPSGGGEPVYVACLVLSNTRLDVNKAVRHRMGVRKASFASADETIALTRMMIGGVTAFALPDGLPLWIDDRVMERKRIIVGGGSRSCKALLPPEGLLAVAGAEIVTGLATVLVAPPALSDAEPAGP